MRQLTVRDIMTADPVTVTPATPLKELAGILVEHQLGAVPVAGPDGEVIGVVSETHLVRKEELRQVPGEHHKLLQAYRARRPDMTAEIVGEIMTAHPVTVRDDATVVTAARLIDRYRAGCLPVLDQDGKLAGVVSPRDVIKVFLRPDDEIRDDVIGKVLRGYLGTNPATVTVKVRHGVVSLSGEIECKSMLPFVLPTVRAVDGVIDASAELTYAIDDTRRPLVPDVPRYY